MAELSFDEAAKELEGWAASLLATIKGDVPQARESLEGGISPDSGAPSRAAMAELCLRKIGGRIAEVTEMYKILIQAVYDHPSANRKD